ncbi:nucleoside hydrolase [Bacillus sp. 03113]|uniref:nucleoside hydrolase n=1 Tax=Bacillus sp. 03113 TaxID=2578211 RepID=UPI0011432A77|nr:nucleoside hydrolase [Bacillus sp. 03113]
MSRIILDTDIGTNADDAVALSLALKSPEIILEGVTTVYGNVITRASIAHKINRLCGQSTKIYPGIELPLLRNRKVFWTGIEDELVGEWERDFELSTKHAVDYMVETVMEHPREITLVGIGPLTNIAAALIREPQIARNVKEIVLMGGVTRLGSNGIHIETHEHNVKCDPEAAFVVFSSGAPIVMIGLDVTRQLVFSREENDKFASCGTPLALTLTKMIEKYMNYMKRDFSYMCDPLAISLLLDRSLVETKKMNVRVEYDHREMTGQTIAELSEDGNVEVALEVDYDKFFKLLKRRVFS